MTHPHRASELAHGARLSPIVNGRGWSGDIPTTLILVRLTLKILKRRFARTALARWSSTLARDEARCSSRDWSIGSELPVQNADGKSKSSPRNGIGTTIFQSGSSSSVLGLIGARREPQWPERDSGPDKGSLRQHVAGLRPEQPPWRELGNCVEQSGTDTKVPARSCGSATPVQQTVI
jgi:hypothetical protein